jgi:hypothetical protein
MKLLARILLVIFVLGSSGVLLALQGDQIQFYHSEEGPASNEKAEFAFTRLRYPTKGYGGGYRGFSGFSSFRPNNGWSEDYPKADRQFVEGVVRLTRVNARSYQEVVDPETEDLFDWPWMYAVNVANWDFTPEQAARLREYLLKGGFLVVDSIHGSAEWPAFLIGMHKIFPDRLIEDVPDTDDIFHVLYDLNQKFQVPGYQYMSTGRTYEMDGFDPTWRAIRDDQGRIMVLIGYNMHIGDAWEHADEPWWPERFSSLAYRLGINYIIYSMTH